MRENPKLAATILIYGQVRADDFPPWIMRHARKLGLSGVTTSSLSDCLCVQAQGSDEMLNALATGCSLGPASVLVDRVVCTTAPPAANDPQT